MSEELFRLRAVEIREVWPDEAQDFTPWLAKEENLDLLGEKLGIELEFEAQEKDVGEFRSDILCRDTLNNSRVLIENQMVERCPEERIAHRIQSDRRTVQGNSVNP